MGNDNPVFDMLKEIQQLGCSDEALCAATYRIYIHLHEERALSDVSYHYSAALDTLYLKARKTEDPPEPEEIYIPVLSFDSISMQRITQLQTELATPDPTTTGHRCIVLAFCDPSSSVLLYRMTDTIKPLASKPPSRNQLVKLQAQSGDDGAVEELE